MAHQVPTPKAILRGHKAAVHVAAFYRKNKRLVTGDSEGWVVCWDLSILRPTAVWRAHEKAILGLQGWGEDKLISHGRDHRLIVWDFAVESEAMLSKELPAVGYDLPRRQPWIRYMLEVNTMNFCSFAACPGEEKEEYPELADPTDVLLAVPNTLVAEAIDIYTLPQATRIHTVSPGKGNGMAMSSRLFHNQGCLTVLAGFENGLASVHRFNAQGQWIMTYRAKAHSQPILSLDVHPNREWFFTSSADSIIAKHPVALEQQLIACTLPKKESPVPQTIGDSTKKSALSEMLRSSEDSPASSTAETRKEWEHPLKTINTKHAGQQSLKVRSDGKIFATAGWDSNIRVFSCKKMEELAVLQWHRIGTYAIAFATLDVGNSDPTNETSRPALEAAGEQATEQALEPTSKALSSARMTVHERRVQLARTAHWIAAGGKDGKISLWILY